MTNNNPLLAKVRIPGATFRLPSQGLFYEDGELSEDVVKGEVEVHPMTALDEIVLATPDKLLSGKAIMEIFARCIPQVRKPERLLTRDVDFLMVCLRAVSFGDTMDVTYQHTCEKAKTHTLVVDVQQMIRSTKVVDPTTISQEYTSTMPNGQIVTLKPLTYDNVVELYQNTALMKDDGLSLGEAEQLIIDTLANVIRRVDDVSDRDMIREWVASIPLGWKRKLESDAQAVSQWGVDFTTKQRCPDCGAEVDVQVSANPVSFFS